MNLTDLFNFTNWTSFVGDFNWSSVLDNLTSIVRDINLTSICKDNLNLLLEKWNLTKLSGLNTTNLTSILTGLNLSSLIDNFNSSSIIGKINSSAGSFIDDLFDRIYGRNTDNNTGNVTNTSKAVVKNSIKSANLNTYYDKLTTFKVTVMSGNKPVTSGKATFIINNKKYTVNIASNGVAVLKLNLKPGTYTVTSKYSSISVKNKIVVKKSIITKNVSKKYKKTGKFTVKVLNSKGKVHSKQLVKIKLKGKTYTAKTNSKGIATFKLSKSLKVGKYIIKTTCKGLTLSNKLTVKK